MTDRIDADELLAEATAQHAGGGGFDPASDEPFRIICRGLETTANLTHDGRVFTRGFLRRLLDGHLAIDAAFRADPTLADEVIEAPIFVIGAPRTGTTALHRLLASDPQSRVPEGWEFLYPTEPDEPAIIDAAAEELGWPQSVQTGIRSIHTYSARMPKECLSAMSFSFRSEEFISRYHLPEYVEWLFTSDLTPAYEMHRKVLQVLQRRRPTERWVLKSPVHLQGIPELVATYPGASYVGTHREPVDVLASVSSLIATLRAAFSTEVDRVAIGTYHADLYERSLRRMVGHVDRGPLAAARTAHVRHRDLVRAPVQTVRSVYVQLGVEWDGSREQAAIEAASAEREDSVGRHQYDAADYGLDPDALRPRFAEYRERFLA